MRLKLFKYLVKITPIILCWLIFFGANFAQAAKVNSFYDQLSDVSLGVKANHTITFDSPSGVQAPTDTIIINFGSSTNGLFFNLNSLAVSDIELSVDNSGCNGNWQLQNLSTTVAPNVWGVNISAVAHRLTLAPPTNIATNQIASAACVQLKIGNNISGGLNQLVNPNANDGAEISLTGGFGDFGRVSVLIMNNGQLNVGADVTPDSFNVGTSSTTTLPIATSTPPTTGGGGGSSSGGTPDLTPPAVLDFEISDVTTNSAKIEWKTDEPVVCQLQYGNSLAYGGNILTSSYQRQCEFTLTNLLPASKYYFRAMLVDRAGNQTVTDSSFFTHMKELPGGNPDVPKILNVNNFKITKGTSSLQLNWVNPQTASQTIEILRSEHFYPKTELDGLLVYHAEVIGPTGQFTDSKLLKAGVVYYYTIFTINPDGSRSTGAINLAELLNPNKPENVTEEDFDLINSTKATTTASSTSGQANNKPNRGVVNEPVSADLVKMLVDNKLVNNKTTPNQVDIKESDILTVQIDKKLLPDYVDSVLVSVKNSTDNQQIILGFSPVNHYFFGNIGPLATGEYYLNVYFFDKNNVLRNKLSSKLKVENVVAATVKPIVISKKAFSYWWYVLLAIGVGLILIVWRRKR